MIFGHADTTPGEFNYHINCTSCEGDDEHRLNAMLETGEEISRKTFVQYVNRGDLKTWEHSLGYRRGELVMSKDWHVSYYKGLWDKRPCVYFAWSHIEHIFVGKWHIPGLRWRAAEMMRFILKHRSVYQDFARIYSVARDEKDTARYLEERGLLQIVNKDTECWQVCAPEDLEGRYHIPPGSAFKFTGSGFEGLRPRY